ncbi:unnamed protein product, partial [Lymnaea stagnalis]
MSLLNIFIVLGNLAAILIVAYAKCATRRKQRDSVKVENGITKILMISMVISDAIFGVTGMPLMVIELYHSGHWTLGPTWCFIKVLAHYLWCPLVMCHVVCMAVDRFLAVCKPLVYRSLSFKLGYCLVGLCWGLSLLIVLTPMAAYWFNLEDNARPCSESNSVCDFMRSKAFVMLNYFFIGFSPITAILVLYFFIIREILRSSKRIANSYQIGSITRTHCRGLRQMRAVRTIGLIVMFFSISWIPVFICLPIFTVTGSHLPSWLILVMIFCNYSNAAVNPVLF